jgi:hypothetical protein
MSAEDLPREYQEIKELLLSIDRRLTALESSLNS